MLFSLARNEIDERAKYLANVLNDSTVRFILEVFVSYLSLQYITDIN